MNPGLVKLANESYERIRVHELRMRRLKEGDLRLTEEVEV